MNLTDEQLRVMVDRFLSWPLPESVYPDAGKFDAINNRLRSGTNLLTATEARQMLEHVLAPQLVAAALDLTAMACRNSSRSDCALFGTSDDKTPAWVRLSDEIEASPPQGGAREARVEPVVGPLSSARSDLPPMPQPDASLPVSAPATPLREVLSDEQIEEAKELATLLENYQRYEGGMTEHEFNRCAALLRAYAALLAASSDEARKT